MNNTPSILPTLLLVLFVGLKLTGHIGWSWWWVLSPVWIPALLVICILVAGAFYGNFLSRYD